jgi:beta-mannosidase
MKRLDLGGEWKLAEAGSEHWISGRLPGCNYLDLMAAGEMQDPFRELNETEATKLGEKDFVYSRQFTAAEDLLRSDCLELVVSGLDTIAAIFINEIEIARCDNAHRTWRLPVKDQLVAGENSIRIEFSSPVAYTQAKQKVTPLSSFGMAENAAHIRKPQCHFGWDWGPNLPPVGIHGSIGLEGYSKARLTDVRLEQEHSNGEVELRAAVKVERLNDFKGNLEIRYRLENPQGKVQSGSFKVEDSTCDLTIKVEAPQLWWPNGLGGQPLYQLDIELVEESIFTRALDTWQRKIGLRTITLNIAADKWGRNFQFVVNGVPIFAKGADWIPSDSFVTRTTPDDLDFYIRSARDANMNMLRVWGGGYYESDTFYDLCDRYGILIWQDFAFACAEYPLEDQQFLENFKQEMLDNMRRLRNHASLALWCGNNEIKIMQFSFKKEAKASHDEFFFNTLAGWAAEEDRQTPYWASSPSSIDPKVKGNSLNVGDTHLWQVWHGMQPLESFRNYPTRFCSEFGVESLPSMRAIRSFTDEAAPTIFDPVMQLHQKSVGGNEKMLYYVLSKYRNPSTLESFIYLSQLIQSETVREATEFWRRNTGRCNGAIFWQFNDCWPVASWAGIDYLQQFKAVQYRARHFNSMVCVSAEMRRSRAEIFVINDLPAQFEGSLTIRLVDFAGNEIYKADCPVSAAGNSAGKLRTLKFAEALNGRRKEEAALVLELRDAAGNEISSQRNLLVADKEAALQKPHFSSSISVSGETGSLSISADTYARIVDIEIDGVTAPLSDNFFDIEAGQTRTVQFAVPAGTSKETLEAGLHLRSMVDVQATGTLLNDKWLRVKMLFHKPNLMMWFIFKFLM